MIAASLVLVAFQASTPSSAPSGATASPLASITRPVARVGTHEVTIGEIAEAARAFYPEAATELAGEYGERFFDSDAFDAWVDAYVDLLVLRRDPRVRALIPDPATMRTALRERASMLSRTPNPSDAPPAASKPGAESPIFERVRRLQGFDVARQVILDQLVPEVHSSEALHRHLQELPWQTNARARVRTLLFSTRDPATGKRLPRARREQIREDAERVLVRLRAGEPFADVERQVLGARPFKPTDTLPWMSFDTPLPAPLLYAILPANAGDYVGPIATADGFVIAKIEERAVKPAADFEKIADSVASNLRRHSQYELLQKRRSDVEIVIY